MSRDAIIMSSLLDRRRKYGQRLPSMIMRENRSRRVRLKAAFDPSVETRRSACRFAAMATPRQ
jgi:hypothetical protein